MGAQGTDLEEYGKKVDEKTPPTEIKPLADRVAVKPLEVDVKTPGGIFIPPTAAEKPQKGEIIATGPGKMDDTGKVIPMELKKGDIILFGKYTGTEITLNNEPCLIMRESDVLAVVGPETQEGAANG